MAVNGYVAFDLGAESGRAMLATLKADRLEITEAHRFLNLPQKLPSGLHWNLLDLWANLVEGLRKCAQMARERDIKLVSLGVDTWGVDFGLVGESGQLLGLPFAYRDARNEPAMKAALAKLGEQNIYRTTGIQFMPFNTLYQLAAQHKAEPKLLSQTARLLMMPDLLHYFFSGKLVNEATIASTTQMIDPRTGLWAPKLLKGLGLPTQFLGETVPAGTAIGTILPEVAQAAGLTPAQARGLKVILPGSHDTASAVAAVPVDRLNTASGNWAYLSSGTWSLMGAELAAPLLTDDTRAAGFTNERGVGGKIRFLKNISGLWLVQECRRDLARRGEDLSYQTLTDLAAQAEPFRTLLDPNFGPFGTPGDMLAKVTAFAKKTRQPAPTTPGQFVRACLESLALTYRHTLDNLEGLLGRHMDLLHVVGGGGQNLLLNQMTADALGRTVVVGPFEATAIGNALTQAMGAGQVEDLLHLRRIVSRSFRPVSYEPANAQAFSEQRSRFEKLLES